MFQFAESEATLREWYIDSGMTPELYAAKRAHMVGCFSLHEYSYRDSELDRWISRFGEIHDDPQQLDECRRKHLSEKEYEETNQFIRDVLSGKVEL